MIILDGRKTSSDIKEEIKAEVDKIKNANRRPPHLVAILVGDNPASKSYVRNKIRFCEYVGYKSTLIQLDASISEQNLLDKVAELNADDSVDGYIVQLPLPKHIDEERINLAIDYQKCQH